MNNNKKSGKSLSHLDDEGRARMVDVGDKPATRRTARAAGCISMAPETLKLLVDRELPKGDVLAVARVAGIMAAKKTARLIPMCHQLNIENVAVDFTVDEDASAVGIEATVSLTGKTGVEMEALTAVAVAALTIYDMCKAVDKGMEINAIQVLEKKGGKGTIA
jgi:cyclic pyranopterin phosphate synthase